MPPPRSLALQRSVSSRLMSADQMRSGEEVWVEDQSEVWVLTDLLHQQNTLLRVRRKDTGLQMEVDMVRICDPSIVGVENGCLPWLG